MKHKRFLLIAAVLLIVIGGLVMFSKLFRRSPYYTEGKLRSDITLKEILEIEAEHGELLSAGYSSGGGMEGDTYSLTVGKEEDGSVFAEVRTSPAHYIPVRVFRYDADPELFRELKDYADTNHLSVWSDLPYDDSMMAMDAPSSGITLIYDDSVRGASEYEIYGISYDNVIPEGGMDILKGFTDLLNKAVKEDYSDTFLDHNGQQIRTGREISNSDEEIGALLTGNWRSEKVIRRNALDQTEEEILSDDSHFYLFDYMGGYDELELISRGYEEEDAVYHLSGIHHDPLPGYDSSWYAEFICETSKIPATLMITVAGDRLYMEKTYTYADSYVSETIVFARQR